MGNLRSVPSERNITEPSGNNSMYISGKITTLQSCRYTISVLVGESYHLLTNLYELFLLEYLFTCPYLQRKRDNDI